MRHLFWLLFGILSTAAFGQDISNFTQFFINPYTLNPSYAGIEGRTALFAGYRKQWTSIEGAPVIANFSLHTPLSSKLNFGFSATSDKRGIAQVSAAMLTVGYTAVIDNTTSIRFGISAGYGSNSVDLSSASSTVTSDPALKTLLSNNSFLIGNAGISFHKSTFHGGVTMPNIFQPVYLSKDAFNVTALKPFQSIVVHASNRFYSNKDQTVFEPYLIYRLNNGLPSQFELAAVVHLQHVMWVGASYKQQFGISGLLGFKIQNQFAVGFSYSLKNGGTNQIPAPSYEIQLGYLVGNKKKNANAYSFVDTHKEKVKKKTAAEILAEKKKQQQIEAKKIADEKKKHEELLAKQKAEELAKKTPKVEDKPFVQVEQKKDTARGGPRMKQHADLIAEQQKATVDPLHLEEQEKIKRLEVHADNPTEEHGDVLVHPHAERHEFVKKGSHHEEMDYGDYVIVGVFKGRPNSERFSIGLNKMSFTSDFGFLTEKSLWYVYIAQTSDINEAKAERDKYRKLTIFRDAWLLTVHK
ncbi:MAG: PorP/SprF family type IX secretion system membrane protein [Bacteroidetes bacterium]|nr:PorP/SprF family type IX secretion system membrane protein [Bacteroidota bacterium]